MTFERLRRGQTRTLVLDQSVDRVFAAIVDPRAAQWIAARCAYSVAAPGQFDAPGALRCCWLDKVRRGVRAVSVLELVAVVPNEFVSYVDRSRPAAVKASVSFRLASEGAGTRVHITAAGGRHQQALEDGLREAAAGTFSPQVNPQTVTLAAGLGAKNLVHEVVIRAAPKRVWKAIEDARPVLSPAGHALLTSWQSGVDNAEFDYSISRLPDGTLQCLTIRVMPAGSFHVTTIDSTGIETEHQLLPHGDACLLRTTMRWTIPLRSKAVRTATREWQGQVRMAAAQE